MSTILHVLNGDATLHSFEQTGLEGDVLVWREIFSQGPLAGEISSAAFWDARAAWIDETFNQTAEQYQEKVVSPLEKLNSTYNQINLWFEFDLHCQANLLGVLALLAEKMDLSPPAIFLICPADFPGKRDFRGIGELSALELEYLYDNVRIRLGEPDFLIAEQAWKLFAEGQLTALAAWVDENHYWGGLHLLKPALKAHLKRLALNENGLNYIEQRLLDIYNSGVRDRQAIYQAFWKTEKIYGMGDSEIDIYLRKLTEHRLIELKG